MKLFLHFWLLYALPTLPRLMAQDKPIMIRGATILTISGSAIPDGSISLYRGKILAIGTDLPLPPKTEVIDGAGKYVMPGLVDAMPALGLAANDRNEPSDSFTPQLRAIDTFHPSGAVGGDNSGPIRIREPLEGGVTTIYLAPAGGGVIRGQGAVVKTAGNDLASLIVREPAAIDFVLGASPKKAASSKEGAASTPSAQVAMLRQMLIRAQEYDRNLAQNASTPRDLGMDAVGRLFKLEIPARVQANSADEIRDALNVTQEFSLDLILCGGAAAYEHRHELTARRIPVIVPPGDNGLAAKLWDTGLLVALASFSRASGDSRKWRLLDALASSGSGLSEGQALQSVTLVPAQILGVSQRLGTLEVGKDADVIVLDGPPLSPKTMVERVYVNGELVHRQGGQ